jgi:hypothetical protein
VNTLLDSPFFSSSSFLVIDEVNVIILFLSIVQKFLVHYKIIKQEREKKKKQ